jgi:hypothetical protein
LITVDKACFDRSLFASSNQQEDANQKDTRKFNFLVAGSFHINGLPISGEGPYAMVDSTTAGAARRPSFIL